MISWPAADATAEEVKEWWQALPEIVIVQALIEWLDEDDGEHVLGADQMPGRLRDIVFTALEVWPGQPKQPLIEWLNNGAVEHDLRAGLERDIVRAALVARRGQLQAVSRGKQSAETLS
jgi:hypothetical protein